MDLFIKFMTAGLLCTSPCSHDENGTMHDKFQGLLITGKNFHSISENRYFITYPEDFRIKSMREYRASDRYIPASEELAKRLKPGYSPAIFAMAELVIRDDTILCIHNHSAYIVDFVDFDITTPLILMEDIPAFTQTVKPFVPIQLPQKETPSKESRGA